MRKSQLALVAVVLSVVMPLGFSGTAVGASAPLDADAYAVAMPNTERKKAAPRAWAPPDGVLMSNPTSRNGRNIIHRILRAVEATKRGQMIRIAVWNFYDGRSADVLLAAKRRGVTVQVITSGMTANGAWYRLRRGLNANKRDNSFAMACRGACNSNGYSMHAKFALFSKAGWRRNVSMVGSFNLTKAAGQRQYNDLVTQHNRQLYDDLTTLFKQMRKDRNHRPHPTIFEQGRYKLAMWPHYRRNLIADEVNQIRCKVGSRTTVVRIAIASWWDAYGDTIAKAIRRKWNEGCNIRILITDAGGGIMRTLGRRSGRGPVPIKRLTVCCSSDGVPSKYLHMKVIAVRGGFGADNDASVMLTGSPNWSTAASRTDELTLRVTGADGMVSKYIKAINSWFNGPVAHARSGEGAPALGFSRRDDLPEWFELN